MSYNLIHLVKEIVKYAALISLLISYNKFSQYEESF